MFEIKESQGQNNYISVISSYIFYLVNGKNESLIKLNFQPNVDIHKLVNLTINNDSLLESDLHLSKVGKVALISQLESFFNKRFYTEKKEDDYLCRDYKIKDLILLLQ